MDLRTAGYLRGDLASLAARAGSREAFVAQIAAHFEAAAGQAELAQAPPWHRDRTPRELAEQIAAEIDWSRMVPFGAS